MRHAFEDYHPFTYETNIDTSYRGSGFSGISGSYQTQPVIINKPSGYWMRARIEDQPMLIHVKECTRR